MARDCPKMDFAVRISKIQLQIWNQLFQGLMCAYFQAKLTSLTLLAQTCPKTNFGVKFQKTKSEFGISTSKIPCVPIFKQNGHL